MPVCSVKQCGARKSRNQPNLTIHREYSLDRHIQTEFRRADSARYSGGIKLTDWLTDSLREPRLPIDKSMDKSAPPSPTATHCTNDLSHPYNAASVALGKVSAVLDLAPTRHRAPTRHLAPGLLAPARQPVPALRAPTRNIFGLVPQSQCEKELLASARRPVSALRAPTRKLHGLVPENQCEKRILAPARRPVPAVRAPTRNIFGLIPENQYENNHIPKKFQLGYALLHHWEIIPLFVCVAFDMFVVLGGGIYTAVTQKVDTQFSKHNWNCISRNMDLRNPTIHKHLVLYQRYEPWPEMQAVLDKMTQAEHRKQASLDKCGTP